TFKQVQRLEHHRPLRPETCFVNFVTVIIRLRRSPNGRAPACQVCGRKQASMRLHRSEEHTSELQSQSNLVCRLLLEKKKKYIFWMSSSYSNNSISLKTAASLSSSIRTICFGIIVIFTFITVMPFASLHCLIFSTTIR